MVHYAIGYRLNVSWPALKAVHFVSLMCWRCALPFNCILWLLQWPNKNDRFLRFKPHFFLSGFSVLTFCCSCLTSISFDQNCINRFESQIQVKLNSIQTWIIHTQIEDENMRLYLLTWWNRMNSRTRSIWVWYLAVPEYNRWIIAETLPKILAYIRANELNERYRMKMNSNIQVVIRRTALTELTYQIRNHSFTHQPTKQRSQDRRQRRIKKIDHNMISTYVLVYILINWHICCTYPRRYVFYYDFFSRSSSLLSLLLLSLLFGFANYGTWKLKKTYIQPTWRKW